MSEYRPIPVDAAKRIAAEYSKDIVVICGVDHLNSKVHFTSYGQDPIDKIFAASISESFQERLQVDHENRTRYEDFRDVPAANSRRHVELLVDAARRAIPLLQATLKPPVNRTYDPERVPKFQKAIDQLQAAIAWKPEEATE